MKNFTIRAILSLAVSCSFAGTITVTNINDSGAGSLRQAVLDAVDSDTIRFDENLISTGSATITLSSFIQFDKGLVFKGLYNSTDTLYISGSNTTQIFNSQFNFASNRNLVIDSLCLINANSTSGGGAIEFYGGDSLIVSNATFINNTGDDGGAINVRGNSNTFFRLDNSTISNNHSAHQGGGININDSHVIINNSIISNNSAELGGGISSLSASRLLIFNSTISNNTADGGGGMYIESADSVYITNTDIAGNTASIRDGGGIHIIAHDASLLMTIANSTVDNNSAINGGGIYAESYSIYFDLEVVNTTIENNSATLGGGIYAKSQYNSNFTVSNSTLTKNVASANGGGIYTDYMKNFLVENSELDSNTANNGGGIYAISHDSIVFEIANSNLVSNSATLEGGGVYTDFYNSNVNINNTTLSSNTASSGGGIYTFSHQFTFLTLTNSTIVNNSVTNDGGGVYADASNPGDPETTVSVTNCTIADNTASFGNGIYADAESPVLTIKGSIIHNGIGNIWNNGESSITSQGYNVFSDAPTGAVVTDQTNVTSEQLNFGPLEDNGNGVPTMLPLCSSVAINAGDPIDNSDAQNGVICQSRREIGAAENCSKTSSASILNVRSCNSYTSPSGLVWTESNIYLDTIANSAGCDSVITINLIIYSLLDQTLAAAESELCENESTTIDLLNSEKGVDYYLRDNENDNFVAGPFVGTDSVISLGTGAIDSTTTYNVYAERVILDVEDALRFNGNAGLSKVSLGTTMWDENFAGTNQITVEAWIKRSASGSLQTVMSNYQGAYPFLFRIDNNNIKMYVNSGASVTSASTISEGTWTHIAGTYDGVNLKVYINGVLEGSVGYTNDFIASSNDFKIGGGLANNTEYFIGDIADVRIWNVARTQSEIALYKDVPLIGTESGLVGNYQFHEGFGSSASNSATGNAYPGSINNPIWVEGPMLTGFSCDFEMTTLETVTVNEVDVTVTDTNPTLSSNAAGAIYQWIDCDNDNAALDGEEDQAFTANTSGNYAVEVTSSGCVDTSDCINITIVGVESLTFNQITVYPNPVNDVLYVDFGELSQPYSFTLTSVEGELMYPSQYSNQSQLSIDLSQFTEGIYFINFVKNNETKTYKIMKE